MQLYFFWGFCSLLFVVSMLQVNAPGRQYSDCRCNAIEHHQRTEAYVGWSEALGRLYGSQNWESNDPDPCSVRNSSCRFQCYSGVLKSKTWSSKGKGHLRKGFCPNHHQHVTSTALPLGHSCAVTKQLWWNCLIRLITLVGMHSWVYVFGKSPIYQDIYQQSTTEEKAMSFSLTAVHLKFQQGVPQWDLISVRTKDRGE